MSSLSRSPVLQFRNVHVWYKDVHALQGIDFDLYRGEIHAVIGERRAGKSSLLRLLDGEVRKTQGEISLDGREVAFFTPATSYREGIGIVHQTPNLVPALSVIENVFLGRNRWLIIKPQLSAPLLARCRGMFADLHVDMNLRRPGRT